MKKALDSAGISYCIYDKTIANPTTANVSEAMAAGLADKDTPCEEAAERFIQAVKDMKKRFGIGDHIPEIHETDIPKLAHYSDKEANPLYPLPVPMSASELEPFYRKLMSESGETSAENIFEKGEN